MENVNKENLFNELMEKYPEGMKIFCDFIDEYKKKNNWDVLFNGNKTTLFGPKTISPKFHELPIAMQTGIWFEFIVTNEEFDKVGFITTDIFKSQITEAIEFLHLQKTT